MLGLKLNHVSKRGPRSVYSRYRDSHYEYNTIVWVSYLYIGSSSTDMARFYWDAPYTAASSDELIYAVFQKVLTVLI